MPPVSINDSDFNVMYGPWRAGNHLLRTLYAVHPYNRVADGDPSPDLDVFLGIMDTAELAAEVVLNHNNQLAQTESRAAKHIDV